MRELLLYAMCQASLLLFIPINAIIIDVIQFALGISLCLRKWMSLKTWCYWVSLLWLIICSSFEYLNTIATIIDHLHSSTSIFHTMENQCCDKNQITTINKVPTTTKMPFHNTTMVFSWPSFFKTNSDSTKQGQMKNPDTWKKKRS
jgi:hypothetical protein